MVTSLLVGLVLLAWLRLFVIFALVIVDHVRRPRTCEGASIETLAAVTILIPAFQEEAAIERTLESVREAVNAGASLVVVDDGSTDLTANAAGKKLASLGAGKVICHERNLGKAAALNTGLCSVATPLLMTLDADTVVGRDAIAAAVQLLRDDEASARRYAVVAFDVSVEPSANLFSELQGSEYDASLNFERRGQAMIHAVSVAPGAASLWRTADLRAIGGFSAATVTEDVDATLRLAARGRRAAHCPRARAFTATPKTFAQLMAQRRRWCLGHYQGIVHLAKLLGGDGVFTGLTYPNFFLLSAFMPLTCALGATALFANAGLWIVTLGWLTAFWLATVYAQRFVALRLAGRRITPAAFLLEPFSTQLFHMCAAGLVVYGLLRSARGLRDEVWQTRAR